METAGCRGRQPLARLPGRVCRGSVNPRGHPARDRRTIHAETTAYEAFRSATEKIIATDTNRPEESGKDDRGLECRKCGCRHFLVVYTRPRRGGARRVRHRECRYCGSRMTTWERAIGSRTESKDATIVCGGEQWLPYARYAEMPIDPNTETVISLTEATRCLPASAHGQTATRFVPVPLDDVGLPWCDLGEYPDRRHEMHQS